MKFGKKLAALAVIVPMLMLSACGSDDDSTSETAGSVAEVTTGDVTSTPQDTSATPAPDTSTASSTPVTGEPAPDSTTAPEATAAPSSVPENIDENAILRVGSVVVGSAGFFIDPSRYNGNSTSRLWMDLVYDSMAHRLPSGLEPGLALSWDAIDASTVELKLREGVTFQDDTPFNAEAVKISWDRLIATTDNVKSPAIAAMQSTEVIDEYTIRVSLATPVAGDFISRFLAESNSGLGVASPASIEAVENGSAEFPVGAGPFRFVEFKNEQQVVLERFDGYWNASEIHFAGVEVNEMPNGPPRLAALSSGVIDVTAISGNQVEPAEGAGMKIYEQPSRKVMALIFCTTKPPFESLEARKAVISAIDREAIVENVFAGHATVNPLPLDVGDPYYDAELASTITFDPDAAAAALEASGFDGGTITMALNPADATVVDVAPILQAELAEIGLDVEIAQYVNPVTELQANDPELYLTNFAIDTHASVYRPDAVVNPCSQTSPVYDAYVKATNPTLDDTAARAAKEEFQRIALEDPFSTYILTDNEILASVPELNGISMAYTADQGFRLEGVYLES